MKINDKKTIFKAFIFFAFILTVLSGILPIFTFDLSDVYKNYEDIDIQYIWKHEGSFIFNRFTSYNLDKSEEKPVYERFRIFGLTIYEKGDNIFEEASDYDEEFEKNQISFYTIHVTIFLIFTIFVIYYLYAIYNSIKKFGKTKRNNYVYLGIIAIFGLIIYYLSRYLYTSNFDTYNLGYVNYIGIGVGFITSIISIIMILSAYFIQSYFFRPKSKN